MTEKLYTLQEAYDEILKLKEDMGLKDYHQKAEKAAYSNGYLQACKDVRQVLLKGLNLMEALNSNLDLE